MNTNRVQLIAEIFEDMLRLRRKMAERRHDSPDCGVPWAQSIVLHIVSGHEDFSIKECAEIMRVSSSAVTQMVDALAKSGLLERREDESDRRTVRIHLTPEGRDRERELKKCALRNVGDMLQPLTDAELESYRDLQKKIARQ